MSTAFKDKLIIILTAVTGVFLFVTVSLSLNSDFFISRKRVQYPSPDSGTLRPLKYSSSHLAILPVRLNKTINGIDETANYLNESTDHLNKTTNKKRELLANQRCQEILSQPPQNVTKYRIQLLAAAPGSGSDWCLLTIGLFTGMKVTGVYPSNTKVDSIQSLPKVHLYYKTHYPFIRKKGPVQTYLDTHSERVVLMIRNPFDAGFSDFIRESVRRRKLVNKYQNLTSVLSNSSFLQQEGQGSLTIQKGLLLYLNSYFSKWRYHHKYWLTKYRGPLTVVLYKDLVKDLRLFKDILGFFGYDADSTNTRRERFNCVTRNRNYTKQWKRPSIQFIETSKDVVKKLYQNQTEQTVNFVKKLYFAKYNKALNIL